LFSAFGRITNSEMGSVPISLFSALGVRTNFENGVSTHFGSARRSAARATWMIGQGVLAVFAPCRRQPRFLVEKTISPRSQELRAGFL